MTSHLPGLLFVIPFFAAIVIPVVGLSNTKLCRPIALGALLLLSVMSLLTFDEVVSSGPLSYAFGGWAPPIGIEWVVDGLSGLLMIVVSVVALIALVHAGPFVQRELPGRVIPFYSLSLLLVAALGGMVLTGEICVFGGEFGSPTTGKSTDPKRRRKPRSPTLTRTTIRVRGCSLPSS